MAAGRMIEVETPSEFSAERLDAQILSIEEERDRRNDPWRKEFAQALADVRQALGRASNGDRKPLFVDVSDVFEREYPPTQWQVQGLISRGGIAMLGAEPKSCKTWLAVEIAIAVATGTPVCGEFSVERGVVAYFFAEDLAVQVRNRVRALSIGRGIAPASTFGHLHVCPRGEFIDVTRDEDVALIIASCRRIGKVDMVVLDPLRDISSAAEDKSDEMSPVMRRLRLIGELLGCTVTVSHHAGKPTADSAKRRPGQRMRGSSAIYGSTDSGIYFGLRGGDNVSCFELDVDVEIKGARSAGHLTLTLDVEDDRYGSASKATWSMTRSARTLKATKHVKTDADDTAALVFVKSLTKQSEFLSRRQLRDHDSNPISERRMSAALDRLIEGKRLLLIDGLVKVPWKEKEGGSDE